MVAEWSTGGGERSGRSGGFCGPGPCQPAFRLFVTGDDALSHGLQQFLFASFFRESLDLLGSKGFAKDDADATSPDP